MGLTRRITYAVAGLALLVSGLSSVPRIVTGEVNYNKIFSGNFENYNITDWADASLGLVSIVSAGALVMTGALHAKSRRREQENRDYDRAANTKNDIAIGYNPRNDGGF